MDVPLLVALFTFLAFVLASSAAFLYLNSREALQTWRRRADGANAALDQERLLEGLLDQLSTAICTSAGMVRPDEPAFECQKSPSDSSQIDQCGVIGRESPCLFLGAKLLLAVFDGVFYCIGSCKAFGFPERFKTRILLCLGAACGYYAPVLWLRRVIASRKDALQRAIPDALDLMVVCVEAGLGLDQAIGRVG